MSEGTITPEATTPAAAPKKKAKAKKIYVNMAEGKVAFATEPLNIGDTFTIKVNGESKTVTVDGDVSIYAHENHFHKYPEVEVL